MRWPWVSRLAYDDLKERCVRLEQLVEQKDARIGEVTSELVRLVRHQSGMSETPKPPRPAADPMPASVEALIRSGSNPSIQRMVRGDAYRANARGISWAEIEAKLSQRQSADEVAVGELDSV